MKTDFGSLDSGVERTKCLPWKFDTDLIGRMKGIQGHRNSCYLDATLYSMFAHSTAFDLLVATWNWTIIPVISAFLNGLLPQRTFPNIANLFVFSPLKLSIRFESEFSDFRW